MHNNIQNAFGTPHHLSTISNTMDGNQLDIKVKSAKYVDKHITICQEFHNKSVKTIFDLPWAIHRFYIEPLTGNHHVSRILVRRYMSFIDKIKKSSMSSLKQLLDVVKDDVRLTTGHNLRKIMMLANKNTNGELNAERKL